MHQNAPELRALHSEFLRDVFYEPMSECVEKNVKEDKKKRWKVQCLPLLFIKCILVCVVILFFAVVSKQDDDKVVFNNALRARAHTNSYTYTFGG